MCVRGVDASEWVGTIVQTFPTHVPLIAGINLNANECESQHRPGYIMCCDNVWYVELNALFICVLVL